MNKSTDGSVPDTYTDSSGTLALTAGTGLTVTSGCGVVPTGTPATVAFSYRLLPHMTITSP